MKHSKLLFVFLLTLTFSTHIYSNVTNLSVRYSKGKTFVTWNEEAGSNKYYRIYRSTEKITDISSLKHVAVIPQGSSYDSRYSKFHVIEDLKAPLKQGTGLFVYTPKKDGKYYYAVTVLTDNIENKKVSLGENSLNTPIEEKFMQWPQGVLQKIEETSTKKIYTYFYWNDYSDWPHGYDYYGEYYTVSLKLNDVSKKNIPIYMYLHGVNAKQEYFLPEKFSYYFEDGCLNIGVTDNWVANAPREHYHSWWTAISNHFGEHLPTEGDTLVDYTSQRVVHYIQAVKSDPRFSVDTNRVYLSGSSMGGFGTYQIGLHYSNIFAALRPMIARVDCGTRFWYYWGVRKLNLPARNGVPVWLWNQTPWEFKNYQGADVPPIFDLAGSVDMTHPFYTHSYLYRIASETHHGMWGEWLKVGHDERELVKLSGMPGGWKRFVKNELYPSFSNANNNDNYGNVPNADSDYYPEKPQDFKSDSAGELNCHIDWTSSLHDMGLDDDDLVDNEKLLSITFKSNRANTVVDITPRRIQKFPIVKGETYLWQNIDVATKKIIANGSCTPDKYGLLTVKQFAIAPNGSKLKITSENNVSIRNKMNKTSIFDNISIQSKILTNGANIILNLPKMMNIKLSIYDAHGNIVKTLYKKQMPSGKQTIMWDGQDNKSKYVSNGIYWLLLSDNQRNIAKSKMTFIR